VGWDTLALDTRGHGDSGWPDDADYSLDALCGDLAAVIGELKELPVVVGASMGGMTALVNEAERGPLSRALVLVDIAPRTESQGVARIQAFMTAHLHGFDSLEQVRDVIAAYNPVRSKPSTTDGVRKNVRQHADGRWYWHWDPRLMQTAKSDLHERNRQRMLEATSRISVPVLLVRGSSSDVLSAQGAAEFQALIPHAKYADVSAGHMVAGDDNDVFSGRVLDFLDAELPGS
jgi:pimeloyl-ACP methyl ester carboxylesterase